MKVLFIGDIFARAGRRAVIENVAKIKKAEKIDLVIANAENASHGRSLTKSNYDDLIKAGVDVITMGNHTWDIPEFYSLAKEEQIIRPYNVKKGTREAKYGVGTIVCELNNKRIQITNLLSQQCNTKNVQVTNPFAAMQEILDMCPKCNIHIVDFHAETTSEKKAFLYAFAGKVDLIVGTHTHVQTADEQIYKNTAFITDLGMCGAKESIIGAKPDEIVEMFKGNRPRFHLEPGKGEYQFNSIIVEFDNKTNKPKKIYRYNINNN